MNIVSVLVITVVVVLKTARILLTLNKQRLPVLKIRLVMLLLTVRNKVVVVLLLAPVVMDGVIN